MEWIQLTTVPSFCEHRNEPSSSRMQEDLNLQMYSYMHVLQEKRETSDDQVADYISNLTSETSNEYHECIILRIHAATKFVT
jgi:lantibiotic modifying enzyme